MVSISVFMTLSLMCLVYLFFTKKILIYRGEQVQILKGDTLRTLNHTLGSIKETKVLNRENYLANLFMRQVNENGKTFILYILFKCPFQDSF